MRIGSIFRKRYVETCICIVVFLTIPQNEPAVTLRSRAPIGSSSAFGERQHARWLEASTGNNACPGILVKSVLE